MESQNVSEIVVYYKLLKFCYGKNIFDAYLKEHILYSMRIWRSIFYIRCVCEKLYLISHAHVKVHILYSIRIRGSIYLYPKRIWGSIFCILCVCEGPYFISHAHMKMHISYSMHIWKSIFNVQYISCIYDDVWCIYFILDAYLKVHILY